MAYARQTQPKAQTESNARILRALVKQPDNKLCADCKRNDPRWASWNLGCFVCIRCSGIHRSMGTHISKVKSLDLDIWTPEQMASMQKWGNRRANVYWEAHLKAGHVPPDHKVESFIRSKYELRRWAMEGSVPDDPATLDGRESAAAAPVAAAAAAPAAASASRSAAPALAAKDLLDDDFGALSGNTSPVAGARPASGGAAPASSAAKQASGAGGGLFDLDWQDGPTANQPPTSRPPPGKGKNDILSLFGSSSKSFSPSAMSTSSPQYGGGGNGLDSSFGNLDIGNGQGEPNLLEGGVVAANPPASSKPAASTAKTVPGNAFNMIRGALASVAPKSSPSRAEAKNLLDDDFVTPANGAAAASKAPAAAKPATGGGGGLFDLDWHNGPAASPSTATATSPTMAGKGKTDILSLFGASAKPVSPPVTTPSQQSSQFDGGRRSGREASFGSLSAAAAPAAAPAPPIAPNPWSAGQQQQQQQAGQTGSNLFGSSDPWATAAPSAATGATPSAASAGNVWGGTSAGSPVMTRGGNGLSPTTEAVPTTSTSTTSVASNPWSGGQQSDPWATSSGGGDVWGSTTAGSMVSPRSETGGAKGGAFGDIWGDYK